MDDPVRADLSFCFCGDEAIVLDLGSNRYFGLVGQAVADLKAVRGAGDESAFPRDKSSLVGRIIAAQGEPKPCRLEQVAVSSIMPIPGREASTADFARMGSALLVACLILRMRSIQGVVRWLGRSPSTGRQSVTAATHDVQIARARALVVASELWFRLIGRDGNCLLRASALAHAMSATGLKPTFVIGVARYPFEAHCWVQLGTVLVSDRLESIVAYTPVLAL